MEQKQILIIVVLVLIGGLYYLFSPETRSIAFSVPYQDPVYRTDYSQEPIYRTDLSQDPVYRTDSYQDPVYEQLYSGTIGTLGLTGQTWTITDATSATWTYTGNGFWGKEYTVYVCWKTNCQYYYKIQTDNLKLETKLTGYLAKTRQVVDHYETKSQQVIDHYNTESKQVVDHLETKYRTEYKDVTKNRLEWILG